MTLESRCEGFNVDCEYNNDLDSVSGRKAVYYSGDNMPETVRPDIIVHRRGLNGVQNNLLVVELKKLGAALNNVDIDRQKLMKFTSEDGRNHFAYLLGASLRLGVKGDAGKCEVEWFEDGQETERATWGLAQKGG